MPSPSRKNAVYCPKSTGFKNIPAPMLSIKDTTDSTLGIPRDMKMGRMITPIATTAPAPNREENMAAVTMHKRIQVTAGLSPPSSVVLRIRVAAMPVSNSTRPNHAPNTTFTSTEPQPSGPLWNTLENACIHVIRMLSPLAAINSGLDARRLPVMGRMVQRMAIISIPIIRFPPLAA